MAPVTPSQGQPAEARQVRPDVSRFGNGLGDLGHEESAPQWHPRGLQALEAADT
ncbi:MAG: hypothetical protein JWO38_1322 [Gemmataceae bacterium]|nr:hypothetical protein [Gemmataceae bacterium]